MDSRIPKITIHPKEIFGTTLMVGEYHLPDNIVECYEVRFCGACLGRFWVSNTLKSSIELICPVDLVILDYILSQIKLREFSQEGTYNDIV